MMTQPASAGPSFREQSIVGTDDLILITGANGFIGLNVLETLLSQGFQNLRCLTRTDSNAAQIEEIFSRYPAARAQIVRGNLLSRENCREIVRDVKVIFHLAAGTGEKSFADAFLNSVVTTRNLLESTVDDKSIKRFVSISSFAVYTNRPKSRKLDESSTVVPSTAPGRDAYCFAKLKQDELVADYGKKHSIPYVILRPGVVYGPGKSGIVGRVGLGTFGIFLHLGGGNKVPLTYVSNCADAIVLAGIRNGINGEVFNIVDDNLPSSRQILRKYKKNVKRFRSVPLPKPVSFLLFYLWEAYSRWSAEQLPPTFNRDTWHAFWKGSDYSNAKMKQLLGWRQRVPTDEGLSRYFRYCREVEQHA